ncbi:MAG: G5P family DNA-binding protein [Azoarcus sp.]|jgi:hypothetical protein|nr:G5P family DNA-binding protein [Azoarcus sp.]
MLKLEVRTAEVSLKQGTSAKTGKPYSIKEQVAWCFFVDAHGNPEPYPSRVMLTIEDDEQPYQPGIYELSLKSFSLGKFGSIFCRPKLTPIASVAKKAA